MIKFDIKNRWTGDVQFTAEINCEKGELNSIKIGLAVKWGIKNGAYLGDAYLGGAYLGGANLRDADLGDAYLGDAYLGGADLRGANLRGANLGGAYLRGANLRGANLRDANLRGANLRGANLRDANLRDANLRGANLRDANLRGAYLGDAYLGDAYLGDAYLGDAYLGDAYLGGAYLRDADHISDKVIDGGIRSDGYRFLLTRTEPGEWRIKAGCHQDSTLKEAMDYWNETHPKGTLLGDETRLIIKNMIAIAKLREWPKTGEETPESE